MGGEFFVNVIGIYGNNLWSYVCNWVCSWVSVFSWIDCDDFFVLGVKGGNSDSIWVVRIKWWIVFKRCWKYVDFISYSIVYSC